MLLHLGIMWKIALTNAEVSLWEYARHWLFIYIPQENLFYSELLENVHGNF